MRYISLLLLFSSQLLLAQVSGRVIDADSGQGVEYATVSVLSAVDSSVIGGAVAGAMGAFEMSKVKGRDGWLLRASFIGYDDSFSEVFAGGASLPPNFTLRLRSGAQILEEVRVTGKQLTDIHRLDKQIFDAEQFTNARGGSATDAIANLPAVSVNSAGEINVRGSTGFTLMIDGRPVQTDPATVLAQLPANAVEKIEIITTPGAKYDPDGKAGILNITTRKGTTDGWSLAANVSLGAPRIRNYDNKAEPRRYGADLGATYRRGDWDIGVGLDYRRDDNNGRREGYVSTLTGNVLTEFPSDGERSHDRESYSARLSVAQQLSKTQSLRAGFLAGKRTVWRTADILYQNQRRATVNPAAVDLESLYDRFLVSGDVSSEGEEINRLTYYNENLRVRRGDFLIGTLDYSADLGNDRKLSLSGLYERTILGGPTNNDVFGGPTLDVPLQQQFNTNDNPLDGFRLNADYEAMVGNLKWETGYQFRYLKHPGDFLYQDRDLENNIWIDNPEFTNGILLRRDIHSAYSQFSGSSEQWQYSAGLRLEYFDRSVELDRPATTFTLDRLSLYPSANAKYRMSEQLSARAGYSRRIDRTTTFKMTPFPEREHNETLEQGDAELLPELTDLVELGLIGNFGDNSLFATAYYRRTTDVINRVNTVYNDTILNRIYTNVGKADALGLELGATLYPTEAWRLYVGGNVYRYAIVGDLFGDRIDTNNWIYSVNATSDISFGKNLDFQLGINYLSRRVTAQGEDGRFFNPYLNVSRDFPKQRLAIRLQWQHFGLGLWDNNEQRITTVRDNFFTTTNYVYETDRIRLNVAYRFTRLKGEVRKVKSEFGDKEF
ncbi:outer membrane beta-barrel family protein [Neolewinella agarilytica]|uniref:outer membrane beta-barrel family protein n=1 Tax=Neolewinella agarilytica TaxID=478744 RepID=UPI0023573E69|nr:outer membrane beta-barrel family protein [Neolewinella agarilytica]